MRSLPGYDVEELLGRSASGEVWRARERTTGETVALKRLVEGAPCPDVEALRSVGSPYVMRPRGVLHNAGRWVLVLDHADGGSLAVLLDRGGSLSAGEVVTVGVPLGQALAAAHEAGLVHGRLTPTNVLLTADGMPLLSDLGVGATAASTAAEDVRALALLCRRLLGTPHQALVQVLDAAAVAPEPDAAAFARRLHRACPPMPLRLGHQVAAPWLAGRPFRVVVLLVLLLAGGGLGWQSGRSAGPPATVLPRAAAPPLSEDGWAQVLDRLDARRSRAYAAGDVVVLTQVYAAGSAGLADDTALLRRLCAQERTAHGLRHAVRSVQVLDASPLAAQLRVVDVLRSYELRDRRGAVVHRAPARPEQPFLVELSRTPAGWRLVQVRPAG